VQWIGWESNHGRLDLMSDSAPLSYVPLPKNDRLSINRPTKRGKEKSSDGHCQCEKEMDDHLLTCHQFMKESHIVTRLAKERALLKINVL
jgi:hypothetical protein